jgi:hypothetical protein
MGGTILDTSNCFQVYQCILKVLHQGNFVVNVGIAMQNLVGYSQLPDTSKLGHGIYVFRSNGIVFSHSESEVNNKQPSIKYS